MPLFFYLSLVLVAFGSISKAQADYAIVLSDDSNSLTGKSSRHVLAQFKEQLQIGSNRLSSDYAPRFSDFRYLLEDLEYRGNTEREPHLLYLGLPSSYVDGMLHFDFDDKRVSLGVVWEELAKHSSEFLLIAEMPPKEQRSLNIVWPEKVPSNVIFIGAEATTNLQSVDTGIDHPYASDFALTFFLVLAETGENQQRIDVRDVTQRLRNRLEAETVWSNADQTDKELNLPTFRVSDDSYYANWLAGDEERQRKLIAQKAKEAEEQRKRELAAQQAREVEERRKRELAAQQAREVEERRKRELAAQRAREVEERRKRELAAQRAREVEERRKRELAAQRAREVEERRKRELAAQRAREVEERRKRELAAQRAREVEQRRKRELAAQQTRAVAERLKPEPAAQEAKEAGEQRKPEFKGQRSQEQKASTQEGLGSEVGTLPEMAGGASTAPSEEGLNPDLAQALERLRALEQEALKKEKELEELKKQEAAAKKKRKNTTSFGF